MGIQRKELSKIGYTNNVARSLAVNIINKYCKYDTKEQITVILADLLENPEKYKRNDIWCKLAEHFSPMVIDKQFKVYELSDSGSRGLGAEIAKTYSLLARETCKLPREAQHFAWLDLDEEAGQEYWMSMNLAGDFAKACHEQIHVNLSKVLGLKVLGNVNNHHNFAWREEIYPGQYAIVHRKGRGGIYSGKHGDSRLSGVWKRCGTSHVKTESEGAVY